jgi:hypothetical protein
MIPLHTAHSPANNTDKFHRADTHRLYLLVVLAKDGGAYSVPLRFRLYAHRFGYLFCSDSLGAEAFSFLLASCDPHISANESRCCLGVYGVAVPFQAADAVAACHSCHPGLDSSHACGSPINQRECAGFNWTPFAISTKEPVRISPKPLTSRAGNPREVLQTLLGLAPVLSIHVHGRIYRWRSSVARCRCLAIPS